MAKKDYKASLSAAIGKLTARKRKSIDVETDAEDLHEPAEINTHDGSSGDGLELNSDGMHVIEPDEVLSPIASLVRRVQDEIKNKVAELKGEKRMHVARSDGQRTYFVSSLREAQLVPKKGRVMLYAEACPASVREVHIEDMFALQQPRKVKDGIQFGKKSTDDLAAPVSNFFIWINQSLIDPLLDKGCSIHTAPDQFLRFGLKNSKGRRILLVAGGYAGSISDQTQVEVWSFLNGRLESYSQRNISPRNTDTYSEEIQTIIRSESIAEEGSESLDEIFIYKDLDIERLFENRATYVGFEIFSNPVKHTIRHNLKKKKQKTPLALPALMVLTSVGVTAGGLAMDYQTYDKLNEDFKKELKNFDGDPRHSNFLIERYESYRDYFDMSKDQSRHSESMRRILDAVARVDKFAYVSTVRIGAEKEVEEGYDFYFILNVPTQNNDSILRMGKPLIDRLAGELNANLVSPINTTRQERIRDLEVIVRTVRYEVSGTFIKPEE